MSMHNENKTNIIRIYTAETADATVNYVENAESEP